MGIKLSAENRALLIDYLLRAAVPVAADRVLGSIIVECAVPPVRARLEALTDGELFDTAMSISRAHAYASESVAKLLEAEKAKQHKLSERKSVVAEVNRNAIEAFLRRVLKASPEVTAWTVERIARQMYLSQSASTDQPQRLADQFPALSMDADRLPAFKRQGDVPIIGKRPYTENTIRDRILPPILRKWRETGGHSA